MNIFEVNSLFHFFPFTFFLKATNKLINCSSLSPFSIDEKLEIFFLNYEMMSLLIHENYLPDISVSNFNFPVKLETLEELAEASLALAESDIID